VGSVATRRPRAEQAEHLVAADGVDDVDVEPRAVLRFEQGRAATVDTDDHPPSLRRAGADRKRGDVGPSGAAGSAHGPRAGKNRAVERSRNGRTAIGTMALALAVSVLAACGGTSGPTGIADDVRPVASTVPSWFPAEFTPPAGAIIINYIARPDTGAVPIGRSVTWLVDRPYDKVVAEVDAAVAAAGWTPTDRVVADESGTQRTSVYIETDQVKVVRTFTDTALSGVRVSVELTPR